MLTASLIYHEPQDIRNHLLDILLQMQAAKQAKDDEDVSLTSKTVTGSLFSDEDLSTMFNMYDINHTGMITKSQTENAVRNLIGSFSESFNASEHLGGLNDLVTKGEFVESLKNALYKVFNQSCK